MRLLFFTKFCLFIKEKMSSKKARRVSKIEVPTNSVHEFELGYTTADIQRRREETEARERTEKA